MTADGPHVFSDQMIMIVDFLLLCHMIGSEFDCWILIWAQMVKNTGAYMGAAMERWNGDGRVGEQTDTYRQSAHIIAVERLVSF